MGSDQASSQCPQSPSSLMPDAKAIVSKFRKSFVGPHFQSHRPLRGIRGIRGGLGLAAKPPNSGSVSQINPHDFLKTLLGQEFAPISGIPAPPVRPSDPPRRLIDIHQKESI